MEINLIKVAQGALLPADEHEAEKLRRIKVGALVKCAISETRNGPFHRKFMALVRLGFASFNPPEATYKGFPVEAEFEQFREDLTIAAGFFVVAYRIDGTFRVRAKSISFSNMEQDEFESVFSAIANVLLRGVLARYQNRAVLDNVVNQILGFV
ncbi:MAG: DUF1367 family protein [Telluria sp.]